MSVIFSEAMLFFQNVGHVNIKSFGLMFAIYIFQIFAMKYTKRTSVHFYMYICLATISIHISNTTSSMHLVGNNSLTFFRLLFIILASFILTLSTMLFELHYTKEHKTTKDGKFILNSIMECKLNITSIREALKAHDEMIDKIGIDTKNSLNMAKESFDFQNIVQSDIQKLTDKTAKALKLIANENKIDTENKILNKKACNGKSGKKVGSGFQIIENPNVKKDMNDSPVLNN